MAGTELITLEQVEDVLLHGGDIDVVSPDAVQDDMVRRILASETLEEAFAGFETVPAAQLEGQLIAINGIAWMRSAFEEGPKVYALLNVTIDSDRSTVTVSMGGRSLMASLLWAQRNEAMPIVGTFRKERSKSNPENSYWLFILNPQKRDAMIAGKSK